MALRPILFELITIAYSLPSQPCTVFVSYIRIAVQIIVNNAATAGSIEVIVPMTVKNDAASTIYLNVSGWLVISAIPCPE
jgi:hypothetical protein